MRIELSTKIVGCPGKRRDKDVEENTVCNYCIRNFRNRFCDNAVCGKMGSAILWWRPGALRDPDPGIWTAHRHLPRAQREQYTVPGGRICARFDHPFRNRRNRCQVRRISERRSWQRYMAEYRRRWHLECEQGRLLITGRGPANLAPPRDAIAARTFPDVPPPVGREPARRA